MIMNHSGSRGFKKQYLCVMCFFLLLSSSNASKLYNHSMRRPSPALIQVRYRYAGKCYFVLIRASNTVCTGGIAQLQAADVHSGQIPQHSGGGSTVLTQHLHILHSMHNSLKLSGAE